MNNIYAICYFSLFKSHETEPQMYAIQKLNPYRIQAEPFALHVHFIRVLIANAKERRRLVEYRLRQCIMFYMSYT